MKRVVKFHIFITGLFLTTASCRAIRTEGGADFKVSTIDLMAPTLWESSGTKLSSVFLGTNAGWLTNDPIWTLPGMDAKRDYISHQGERRINHMQYSVKTVQMFKSFRLSFMFRFDSDDEKNLEPSWVGNSGIYIFGLYEVQIFKTGSFDARTSIADQDVPGGMIQKSYGSKTLKIPINQFLCGAIYGGGLAGDPVAGAPRYSDGTFANLCADTSIWHQMTIDFKPAEFRGQEKINDATVAIAIDGTKLKFEGQELYAIPGPTGSQMGRAESESGPIVIQDHGSRVSFKEIAVSM